MRGNPESPYDPSNFARLAEVEDLHFWFRARNLVLSRVVSREVSCLAPGYRVLEVGCGTGTVLGALQQVCPAGKVVGMDLFTEALRFARSRVSCPLVQGDVRASPFGAQFDLIGLFDVLEHIPDDETVLRDLSTMLTDHGALVLTVPAHPSLWSYFDEASHHCRRYARAELVGKLRASGYAVQYVGEFMMSTFPLVWLHRWVMTMVGRRRRNTTDRPGESMSSDLRVWPLINGILFFLLSQEARLVGRGWHLPCGTSLLAVAHRAVRQ